jgi:hypothetical protein
MRVYPLLRTNDTSVRRLDLVNKALLAVFLRPDVGAVCSHVGRCSFCETSGFVRARLCVGSVARTL